MRPRFSLWTLVILLAATACMATPQVTRTPVRLRIGNASDQYAVLDRLIETYKADRAWVSFTHDALPVATALDRVKNDHLDLVLVPASAEQVAARQWQSGFAYDPLTVIVNPANPVDNLSLSQVRDVFQGRAFDWGPFGLAAEVVPVSREAGALARQVFESGAMGELAVTLNAVLKASSADVVNYVAANPGAIGYAPLSQIDDRVKAIALDGVPPTPQTATAGQYPLSTPLYLIAQGEPAGELRDFVAWLLNDGQLLIEEAGLGRVR